MNAVGCRLPKISSSLANPNAYFPFPPFVADLRNGGPPEWRTSGMVGRYSTKKTQNAIRPRRPLPVSGPISEKNVKVRNRLSLSDAAENFCTDNSACSPVVENNVVAAWAGRFVSLLVNRLIDR